MKMIIFKCERLKERGMEELDKDAGIKERDPPNKARERERV